MNNFEQLFRCDADFDQCKTDWFVLMEKKEIVK